MSRYTNYAIKNNVFGTLSAPISSLATTIQLATGQGQRFTADMLATLESVEGNKVTKREIVLITNVTGDTLTVVRKYAACPSNDDANTQGQTSFSFDVDDTINIYIPKEIFDLINNGIKFLETQGTDRMRVLEAASGTPLAIDIMPGNFRCADDNIVYAGVTDQLLTDNATNYIMIDGTGTLQITTTDRDTRYTRLAKVTCASWEITEIQDRRLDTIWGNLWGLQIHTLTEKTVPVGADELIIADSEDSYNNKRITYANLSPATLIRFVTLWETVIAGDGYGAVYIDTDGKAYNSNPAGHNYCDGIVIDSGNAGDTVRMIISWFVPCNSLNGTLWTVHLAYTSNTTNTGYADYVKFTGVNTTNNRVYDGTYITVWGVWSWIVVMWQYWGASTPFIHPLYGVSWAIATTGRGQGATIYYITGVPWQYNNTASYGISGCELWKVVPGWFMFDPKPVEYMVGFWKEIAGSWNNLGTTTGILSNFDGEKTFALTRWGYVAFQIEIQESVDNVNFYSIGGLNSVSQNNNYNWSGNNMYSRIKVKKWRYYRYYGSASYQINGHIWIMAQK